MRNQEYPIFIAQGGPLGGSRWAVKDQLTIGRESFCDISIPDRQVSRQHARLTYHTDGVMLEDLGSKNGTFCNSKRVDGSVRLKEGDEVQIALAQQFMFISSDATLPLEDFIISPVEEHRLRIDIPAKRVWVLDQELEPPLSSAQFSLLQLLYEHPSEVVSRTDLVRAVWGEETQWVSEQALDALIRRLRDRLSQVDPDQEYLVTVRGHGLRLDNPLIP